MREPREDSAGALLLVQTGGAVCDIETSFALYRQAYRVCRQKIAAANTQFPVHAETVQTRSATKWAGDGFRGC